MNASELWLQLPPADLENLINSPEQGLEYVFPPDEEVDVSEPHPLRNHIEDDWHVLRFLITRHKSLSLLEQPKQLYFKESENAGLNAEYLTAPEVVQLNSGLKLLSKEGLLERFNLDELIDEGVYKIKWWEKLKENPTTSTPNLEDTLKGIGIEYTHLVDFFERAAQAGNAMLIVNMG